MTKKVDVRPSWCGRVISEKPALSWKLGREGKPATLPAPFGTFKLGKLYGKNEAWKLRSCRVAGTVNTMIHGTVPRSVETLPPDPNPEDYLSQTPETLYRIIRKLDGTWGLGGTNKVGHFKLNGRFRLKARKTVIYPRFGEFKIRDYEHVTNIPEARLTLSGNWKLGGAKNPVFEIRKVN